MEPHQPAALPRVSYRIEAVNGISSLTVNIDGPGVYVARGPNGAGKTCAIEALKAASGDPSARAEASDGQPKGTVRSGELLLAVGNRRKVTGLPTVRLVSPGALGRLIDPGIKDSDLAARARLRALVELFPMPADSEARSELCAGDAELFHWLERTPSEDSMEVAEAVRKRANELANEQEKLAEQMGGEEGAMTALILGLGALDLGAGDLGQARAEAERLIREADRAQVGARARADLERTQSELRGTLGQRPDSGASRLKVEQLRATIEERERELAGLRAEYRAELEREQAIRQAEATWDSQADILKRTPEGPTLAEAKTAAEAAVAAKEREQRARVLASALEYQGKVAAAKRARDTAAARAEVLRAIAQRTAAALGNLLKRRGVPGLSVADGRLQAVTDEGLKDFDQRLSFGQRVRLAIGVALAANAGGHRETDALPLLPLDPGFWLALDGDRKAEVCAIAKERGVCLVTEEPDTGPLRVERLQTE